MSRIELASKNGRIVTAYNDTVIFHATKGDDTNSRPYGIIQSKYSDPFGISYDPDTREITLNPGIISIYGRQIELTNSVVLDILNGTLNSNKLYFTIYIELDITDFLNQRVMLLADYSNRSYINFNNTKEQNNLYKMEAGIFKAPIRKFVFNPSATEAYNVFIDEGLACEVYDDECVSSSESIKLDGTIGGVSITDLFSYENSKLKANKASNYLALEKYKAKTTFKNTTPGYSVATETNKMGIGENAVEVPSNLSNIYTIKRHTLCSLGAIGCSEWQKTYVFNICASKLSHFRIHFSKKSFTSYFGEWYCGLWSLWDWEFSKITDIIFDGIKSEFWRNNKDSFQLYFWVKWHDVNFNYYEKDLLLTDKNEFDSCSYPENVVGSNGGDSRNTYGKRLYGVLNFSFENDVLKISIFSYGEGPLYNSNHNKLSIIDDREDRGNILIDCIYKGDVRL